MDAERSSASEIFDKMPVVPDIPVLNVDGLNEEEIATSGESDTVIKAPSIDDFDLGELMTLTKGNDGKPVVPVFDDSINDDDEFELESISSQILGDTVDKVKLASPDVMKLPNFVIDGSKRSADEMDIFQMMAIQSTFCDDGDVYVYFITTNGKMQLIGMTSSEKAEMTFPVLVGSVLDSDFLVYRDLEIGKEVSQVKSGNFSNMRLNL